ncbi:hypothetical protein OEA41_003703 [Lepraria neglecta]|uniref:Uncharacterized protein n=1 Tax=Lepraria neglecta TaxID=209136 RepID=A0AAD9Z507_9LECA|nr:hypothetical protein OEA41_003703 [Lepraria neglecta]
MIDIIHEIPLRNYLFYPNIRYRSSPNLYLGQAKTGDAVQVRKRWGEPSIEMNISFREQVLRVLEESDNFNTPIPLTGIFGKRLAHRWLLLVENFEQIPSRYESTDYGGPYVDKTWTYRAQYSGRLRNYLNNITINNKMNIEEFHTDSCQLGDHRKSLLWNFDFVITKVENLIQRTDRHAAMVGTAIYILESRRSIKLSTKIG